MTIVKIGELPKVCQHPEHFPPSMIVLPPGLYKHTCPGCGVDQRFAVHGVTC